MTSIQLPDGSIRNFDADVTGLDLAKNISPSLAKKAVLVRVDGTLMDLSRLLPDGATVEIITRDSQEGLEVIRHDCAHVLAEAVQGLWPDVKVTIGPTIEHGFYYDFDRDVPFREDDLQAIEQRMHDIIARQANFTREVWTRDRAIDFFRQIGEPYKVELIEDLPESEEITIYRQGDWTDLCRGPHAPSVGFIGKGFKLVKVSGSYWRGDHRNATLQRIYGVCFHDEAKLAAHLHMLEEAAKRDHRKLGRALDMFHFQDEAPGSVFWHPKGWTVFCSLIEYLRDRQGLAGFSEVNTPDMMDKSFWETTGHWDKYGENMFTLETEDQRCFCMKPMSCPGAVELFKTGIRSYRDLPLRMGEFGKVHRYEPSGALHGLMRVRSFTQDDAHVFCTHDQMMDECIQLTELILAIYRDFGFEDVHIKFSDRPEKRIGSDSIWDKAETALRGALDQTGIDYSVNPGEGAFYGPKLEFVLRDAIGRDWQCGTIQLDFNLPERLGATYITPEGGRETPVMIHRAMFGSLERFAGILIEHHAGKLPVWLAPVQAVVATIVSEADSHAKLVKKALSDAGLRVELDLRNEKINLKVREHSMAKVPWMLIVGRREAEDGTVALRRHGSKDQIVVPLADAISTLVSSAHRPESVRSVVRIN